MSYDLFIVRRNNFEDYEEESNITLEEWKNLVESSDDLTWEEFPGDTEETNFEYCYWMAYPEQNDAENYWYWFDFSNKYGFVSTRNPDFACMRKLVIMAENLNARVEGMEGEV